MSLVSFLSPKGFYVDEASENYAKIVVPQMEKGYGITIGNALRRVLLSSIEGYSVVAVYIDGAIHEFSAIEGVLEDVPYILLNIKKVKFKVDEKIVSLPAKVVIDVEGPIEVKAEHIQVPEGIEIINKDQYIATITSDRKFYAEIYIDKGIGFVPREEYPEEYKDLFSFGTIFVDGNFSPIEKVNWTIEKTRYEAYMDKDKLILEIWTNGTISPIEAYFKAIEILERHMNLLKNQLPKEETEYYIDIEDLNKRIEEIKKKPINELPIPPKVLEIFSKKGIKTISDLISYTEEEINDFYIEAGFSNREFEELKRKIYSLSLEFSPKSRS
jgi:DNA-directed RNA polymerase subunit alpha